MRGRPWTAADTATLKNMLGKSDAAIARVTGHAEITVRKHREALGQRGYGSRSGWTRRDWLLAGAAGLDFQISD